MPDGIARRDFLNGFGLAVAAGLAPRAAFAAGEASYPPGLTGMRGSHIGAFEVAHRLALEGAAFDMAGLASNEAYDCIVVGAGISGLAAALLYRERFGAGARILILDNHDDFGGHARRNEFRVDGRLMIGYGGSESFQAPRASFSRTVNRLLKGLGIELSRFETAFDRDLYRKLGLSRAIFFDCETFGSDRLVTGDPTLWISDDTVPGARNERDVSAFIADFPMSKVARAELTRLHADPRGRLGTVAAEVRETYLTGLSYPDFLRRHWGLGEEALRYFRQRTADYFGAPPDYVSAAECRHAGYPGFGDMEPAGDAGVTEPYIYHFPDGNASVARLMVRALVPDAVGGEGMDGIVLAPVDYGRLDVEGAPVRLRLGSTAVRAESGPDGVTVGYMQAGSLRRADARHAVMAGWNMAVPYIMPDAPAAQREALSLNVKLPLVYATVAIQDWTAFAKLGIHDVYAPGSFFARTKLDYPVSLGSYRFPAEPAEPMLLHLVHVPTRFEPSTLPDDAYRAARYGLLDTPFASYESAIADQLGRMAGPGGFDPARDIRAITINRWSHGYSNWSNTLVREEAEQARIIQAGGKPIGRIAIANCDRRWDAYLHSAIDAASDAIRELPA